MEASNAVTHSTPGLTRSRILTSGTDAEGKQNHRQDEEGDHHDAVAALTKGKTEIAADDFDQPSHAQHSCRRIGRCGKLIKLHFAGARQGDIGMRGQHDHAAAVAMPGDDSFQDT